MQYVLCSFFYVAYSISALETAGLTSKKVDPQDEDEAPGAGASPSGWWKVFQGNIEI